MAVQDYKINYKSDFVLTINGDAGWAVPFCIKFWTGMPSQAYFVGFDGVKYVNCRVGDTPTQLLVMFDDHHLPIGKLEMQIAYHTTIEEFPGSVFDEVTNARDVIVTIDGTDYQVLLDFTGEDAPELEFDLPAYANEAERIQNELQRQQNEADRIAAELQREQTTAAAVQGADNVNAQLSGNILTVTNRNGVSTSVNTKGEQGEQGPVGPEGPQGEQGVSIVDFSPKSQTTTTLIYTATFSDGHTQDVAIPKGPKGDTGATGPTGPQGPQGDTGVSITGLVKTGETETDTLYNITFSNGTTQAVAIPKGVKGDKGDTGNTGATGATGATGPRGPQGERGLPGESGVTGDVSAFTVRQTIDPSATYGPTDIAGAATVQATNQELTELEGEITEPGTEVILTLYPNVMYTINKDGVWATVYNDNHSIFVPMEDGEYTLTATSSNQALYTVLTSNATPVAGATPAYATGYSNRISIPAGRTATVQGRSGLYLWLRNDTDIDGAMAPLVTYSSGGSRLDAIAQLVPEPVITSLYSTIHFIIDRTTYKWASSDLLFYSKIIPMQDGEYMLSAVNSKSVYTVLSSNTPPVDGQTPAYATGYDKPITIEQGNSEKVKGISGLYLYIRSDDDTTYGVFPPEIKFLAYSQRINPIEDFINNINTYETPGNNTATILGYSSRGNDIYIAASDSSEVAKASADFVCDGVNDEIELKAACLALIGNGVLHMAEGNYYVDSFHTTADGGQPYIMKPQLEQNNITIVCDFNQPIRKATEHNPWSANDITLGAIIRITDNCYNSLDSDTLYTIIRACASNGSRRYPATFLNVRGIGFKIPDNQKQIICIDGYFATAMNINRCSFNFIQDSSQPSSLHNGVMNCIGIRGTQGNNYGVYNHITDCAAWGCGQGFAIGGEHFLVDQCLTRLCRYGFTFNNYSVANSKFIHPIILLNCSDEASFNLPFFGNNEYLQAIYMYGFNIEHENQYFNLFPTEGNYMRELTPGQWRGRVEFTVNSNNNANVINCRLWATDGSGVNVKSINDAQKFICTTSERNSYYPTAGQIVYDTTLGKPVMCIDAVNKTWVDFTGATV